MKKLMAICAAALATLAYAATDMGVLVTSKNIDDYAKVVNGNGGIATVTIVDTNGTANAVTVYNKAQMDTALGNKAAASDVTALQDRATALEGATNALNTAVNELGSFLGNHFDESGNPVFRWEFGSMTLYADKMVFHYSGGHGQSPRDWTINFPINGGTFARTEDIPSSFDYTAITNAPWLTTYTETDPTVPSWAKAPSKPSYNFSEIGSKPTTLSGYGITDAKIANGTITLGSATITPLTSFTETDPTALKPSQLKVNGTAMTTASPAVELGQYYVKTVDGKPHLFLRGN